MELNVLLLYHSELHSFSGIGQQTGELQVSQYNASVASSSLIHVIRDLFASCVDTLIGYCRSNVLKAKSEISDLVKLV